MTGSVSSGDSQSWEYHIEIIKNTELREMGDRLNWLGSMGWEMVSNLSTVKTLVNLTGNDLVFVFKRPGTGPFTKPPEVPWA